MSSASVRTIGLKPVLAERTFLIVFDKESMIFGLKYNFIFFDK